MPKLPQPSITQQLALGQAELALLHYWIHLAPKGKKLADLGFRSSSQAEARGYFCARESECSGRSSRYPGYWVQDEDLPETLVFLKNHPDPKVQRSWARAQDDEEVSNRERRKAEERNEKLLAAREELSIHAKKISKTTLDWGDYGGAIISGTAKASLGAVGLLARVSEDFPGEIWEAFFNGERRKEIELLEAASLSFCEKINDDLLVSGGGMAWAKAVKKKWATLTTMAKKGGPSAAEGREAWMAWAGELDEAMGPRAGPPSSAKMRIEDIFNVGELAKAIAQVRNPELAAPEWESQALLVEKILGSGLGNGSMSWTVGLSAWGNPLASNDQARELVGELVGHRWLDMARRGDPGYLLWAARKEGWEAIAVEELAEVARKLFEKPLSGKAGSSQRAKGPPNASEAWLSKGDALSAIRVDASAKLLDRRWIGIRGPSDMAEVAGKIIAWAHPKARAMLEREAALARRMRLAEQRVLERFGAVGPCGRMPSQARSLNERAVAAFEKEKKAWAERLGIEPEHFYVMRQAQLAELAAILSEEMDIFGKSLLPFGQINRTVKLFKELIEWCPAPPATHYKKANLSEDDWQGLADAFLEAAASQRKPNLIELACAVFAVDQPVNAKKKAERDAKISRAELAIEIRSSTSAQRAKRI